MSADTSPRAGDAPRHGALAAEGTTAQRAAAAAAMAVAMKCEWEQLGPPVPHKTLGTVMRTGYPLPIPLP